MEYIPKTELLPGEENMAEDLKYWEWLKRHPILGKLHQLYLNVKFGFWQKQEGDSVSPVIRQLFIFAIA